MVRRRSLLLLLATATGLAGPVCAAAPPAMSLAQLEGALHAEQTEQGLRVVLPADTLFGNSLDTIAGDGIALLEATERLIAARHPREVFVAGHTDGIGRDDDNLVLSQRRARAVANWLRAHAKEPMRIIDKGYGRTRPLAPNHRADASDDPEGRQQNRRIEIYLQR